MTKPPPVLDTIRSAYGRPAIQALAVVVGAAKAGDPLAPVTVIVESNFAGLVARRLLGRGELAGDSPSAGAGPVGIANVNFFTPFQLAAQLAVGRLGDKVPLTNPVLGAAVRQALRAEPGHFGPVRDHPATEAAVASAVGELANVEAEILDRLESAGGTTQSLVRLHRDVIDRLAGFHHEADIAAAAGSHPDLAAALDPFGTLVWYLPGRASGPLARFLGSALALPGRSDTVIFGTTGVDPADAEPRQALGLAGLAPAGAAPDLKVPDNGPAMPLASHVVTVTDADEEVRYVLRQVVALVESGLALDRIAIFHPTPDPYVRILEQQLNAAGIVANGPSRRRLADSIAGRVLVGALELSTQRWRRDRLMGLVNAGPVYFEESLAPVAGWEAVSRQAGVTGGLNDWRSKLDWYCDRLDRRVAELGPAENPGWAEAMDRDRDLALGLARFVDSLADRLDAIAAAGTWAERSAAAIELLHHLLGTTQPRSWWPEQDQNGFDLVVAALERLAGLDDLDPEPDMALFVRALAAEVDVARGRNGRFGQGLVYGPLATAPGHDLDAVFILGCAEGLCPPARRDDAMIPDRVRALANGQMVLRSERHDHQHRYFLAALAAAPADRRWLLFPRGDLRSSRRMRPSRWLLPSASELAGRDLYASDFESGTPDGLTEVGSHAGAIAGCETPVGVDERDLAAVLDYVDRAGDLAEHPATMPVRRGLELQAARAGTDFTIFDGNLAGNSAGLDDRPQSPTRLETWARCGFRYFLAYGLGLDERDEPERVVELSALERGTAIHELLEGFLNAMIQAGPPAPSQPWSPEQRETARSIAEDIFDELESKGLTGRPVTWARERSDLMMRLEEFLDHDNAYRAGTGSTPTRLEAPFGLDGEDPVEIAIDDRRSLRFRGKIDRVDTTSDGRVFVNDYKTGGGSEYQKIDRGDPTKAGQMLQLGLYAEAVLAQHGGPTGAGPDPDADPDPDTAPEARVDTRYWMVSPRGGYQRLGYPWTTERRDRLIQVLAAIVDGIEAGTYMAVPGDWQSFRRSYENCTYCPFDSICPTDRAEHAADKADHPALAIRTVLTDPEPTAGSWP